MNSNFWDAITIITLIIVPLWLLKRNQSQMNKRIDADIKDGRLGEIAIRQMMSTVKRVQREEVERED